MKKGNLHILSTVSYSNGDPIPLAQNFEEWKKYNNAQQGAYCRYINDENNAEHTLYNWFVLNDERNIIPSGMKLASADAWRSIELELANDESLQGFLKNGRREIFGNFQGKGKAGYYWSADTHKIS